MDLTSLQNTDTAAHIETLCDAANSNNGHPAAVCVFPELVATARRKLDQQRLNQVAVATVVNFPKGHDSLDTTVAATERALAVGATEIDLVLPYQALLTGDTLFSAEFVATIRTCIGERGSLKVIIESGVLESEAWIRSASELAIENGADFIKTSTGKVAVNATLKAAEYMLRTIYTSDRNVGFKAAGGIRTVAEAQRYLQLAATIMGNDWVHPDHFRIGASSLLDDIESVLAGTQTDVNLTKGSY